MVDKEQVLNDHRRRHGKIEVIGNVEMETKEQLSTYYTPGVAYPCLEIKENPELVYEYTLKGRTAAIITDGTRILGLGKIGPEAGLPVMEGKALILKKYAGADAFPICLKTTETEEIIRTVKNIEPVFGIINIEDMEVPKCFEVVERLKKELSIPVFHDDRNGTGAVAVGALLNALKLAGKRINDVKIVVNGAGAAGTGIAELLVHAGAKNVYVVDTVGLIYRGRQENMTAMKERLAGITNKEGTSGDLRSIVYGADVLIGASTKGAFDAEMIKSMAEKPIVFALANPVPEIEYQAALDAGAFIAATGRSDMPNQVNNSFSFPGIMRGALEVRAKEIDDAMLLSAAKAISKLAGSKLSKDYIMPDPTDKSIVAKSAALIAAEVGATAVKQGLARIELSKDQIKENVKGSIKRYRKIEKLASRI